MTLLHHFQTHWRQCRFAKDGESVLIAVSGGADSMVLAALCLAAKIPFALAHVNYGLRGAESDADEQLVLQWAFQHSILCFTERFDTKALATEWKKGIQETARDIRYQWLEDIRAAHGYALILTAHHANDDAETVLMRILAGAGLSGLQGIPERNGNIVRPLLFASKKKLLAYAVDNQVPFREDASNDTDAYLRNKVRRQIIPAAEGVFPEAVRQLQQSARRLGDAAIYYRKAMEQERKKLMERRGNDFYIPVLKLRNRPALSLLCHELLRPFGFTYHQMPDVVSLLSAESGKSVASHSHRVIRNRDFLIVTTLAAEEADFILVPEPPCVVKAGEVEFRFSVLPPALIKEGSLPQAPSGGEGAGARFLKAKSISRSFGAGRGEDASPGTTAAELLSAKELEQPLILRRRRAGDYFYPLGMGMKKKKLSRFLGELKLPLHDKEQVWVLESNRRIVWIAGYRMDERFKVKGAGGAVVRVELIKP